MSTISLRVLKKKTDYRTKKIAQSESWNTTCSCNFIYFSLVDRERKIFLSFLVLLRGKGNPVSVYPPCLDSHQTPAHITKN
jgi:hypothetical protein